MWIIGRLDRGGGTPFFDLTANNFVPHPKDYSLELFLRSSFNLESFFHLSNTCNSNHRKIIFGYKIY